MAQYIQFQIGSEFSGEGFKQAQASIGNMNKNIKSATKTASSLASAFGGLDTSAAKAIGAMTGMLNALMTLNATAIITQAAILAISAYVNKCNKEMETLKERSEELKSSIDKAFSSAVANQVKSVHDEIKAISGEFDRIAAQAAAFTAAVNGLKGSVATGNIINLEIEKVNEMLRAQSDAEKAIIEAEYDLEIATAKAAASREQWNDKISEAHKAIVTNSERIANCDKEIAIIQEKRAKLEEARVQLAGSDNAKAKELSAAIAQLTADEEAIRTKQNDLRAKSNVLLVQEQKTLSDAANAEKEMALAITKATAKIDEAERAAAEAAEKEKQAALTAEKERQAREERTEKEKQAALTAEKERQAREERAKQLKQEREVLKEADKIQRDVNEAARSVAEAERAYAAALAKYEANYADNQMANNIFNHRNEKGQLVTPVRIDGTVKADIVSHDLKDAINNGLIRSVREMDKFARDRAKEIDKNEKKNWHQLEQEAQRYELLQQRGRKTWSKADADFATKFETLKKAADAKVKEVEEAKARLAAEWNREKQNWENLKSIKEKLENLGLK